MADISIPIFGATPLAIQSIPTVVQVSDTTDYLSEARSDYYLDFWTFQMKSSGPVAIAQADITPDNSNPTVVAKWEFDILTDGHYQSIIFPALAWAAGNYVKGDLVHYLVDGKWYVAIDTITGSTDPSLDTGQDVNFIEFTDPLLFLPDVTYQGVINYLSIERVLAAMHNERKRQIFKRYEVNDFSNPNWDKLRDMYNLLESARTDFTVPAYADAQESIELFLQLADLG